MLMEMFMPRLFLYSRWAFLGTELIVCWRKSCHGNLGDVYDPLYNCRILRPETQFLCDVFNFISSCFWNWFGLSVQPRLQTKALGQQNLKTVA